VHEVVVQDDRERRDPNVLAAEQGDHRSAACRERRDRADGPFDGLREDVQSEIHLRKLVGDPLREGSCPGHREDICSRVRRGRPPPLDRCRGCASNEAGMMTSIAGPFTEAVV